MPLDMISVRGAREHNLKNISIDLPRDKLVVLTGLSGSGKSSLAFDTIYAEGQRRYVESLSAYARQFLGQMEKPDVDLIEGLSPAISIDQKGTTRNPRSTVGTVTEVYDYLRLLFARVGRPHCPVCGREVSAQSIEEITNSIARQPSATRLMILAPVVKDRKGEYSGLLQDLSRRGFVRVRVDGEVHSLDEQIPLERYKSHTIEVVVDRIVIRDPLGDPSERQRLAESVETAARLSEGIVVANIVGGEDLIFSERNTCPVHGISVGEIEPRTFSFNSPHGACPECTGLGITHVFDPELVIPNRNLSLAQGAVEPWARAGQNTAAYYTSVLEGVAEKYGFSVKTPVSELTPEQVQIILIGSNGEPVRVRHRRQVFETAFEGAIPNLERRLRETTSDFMRQELEKYMSVQPCPVCKGARLKPESLGVTVAGRNIVQVTRMSIREGLEFARALQGMADASGDGLVALSGREAIIAAPILKEIRERLGFLVDVGLDYLTLERSANTLAGGEAQRIRLATQIGSSLMGVIYILDEPSIGLHQRDNTRLLRTLTRLRDLGNTVLVVEHDEDTMRAADWLVDMGPGAGEHGGEIVAQGTPYEIERCGNSITGQYLSGERGVRVPRQRRQGSGRSVRVLGASENNLKGIDVEFPLGRFMCVTGVSGSGKSTLVNDVLYKALAHELNGARQRPGAHAKVEGIHHLDKVIDIDQSPIGRTPRSNPATYTGVFTAIRDIFAKVPEARARGYMPGRFSFNVKGGRCEACKGEGIIQIEMQFLPDVYVPCEVCHGKRYNRDALDILYKGQTIADVLDMTVDHALGFFENVPAIRNKLETLAAVGLGYIRLGQPATTLSGGEAQRVKLATELSRRATGRTLYILDEPTTGLHFADIERLLNVLQRLTDAGNSVLVIEHNLDVIKSADWIIDLGPEGGAGGGTIVTQGTPEEVAACERSFTGEYLRPLLERELARAS
ncbi:MAG: excinuclease ABC subunit UvrA [Chloroflexota bacterium]|nr:excinuclease ABC subunit UvrA [Chloroflexota bacterium]